MCDDIFQAYIEMGCSREDAEKLEHQHTTFVTQSQEAARKNEARFLAEILHRKFCKLDHTEECGWYYEKWGDLTFMPDRAKWFLRADHLLGVVGDVSTAEVILNIITGDYDTAKKSEE